ncbi:MAG TPA: CARDB domain-containing protein [Solirubrobacteraceae bacterium]|nr:CARDB domain-containing protein [Solirubrobacteraceae bacterium]
MQITRLHHTLAGLLLCAGAWPALAWPAVALAGAPSVRAGLVWCTHGLDPQARAAVFEGSMSSLRRADRMQMRFELLQGLPGAALEPVQAPGLGDWQSARPGVRRFQFRQRVDSLAAPARYRAVLTFRWFDRSGRQVAQIQRRSPVCDQPDLRPALRVTRIVGQRVKDAASYGVTVRNAGRGDAPAFDLALVVDGAPLPAQPVEGLAAGEFRQLTVSGPACAAGGSVEAILDPAGKVDQATRDGDVHAVTCPLGAPASPANTPPPASRQAGLPR